MSDTVTKTLAGQIAGNQEKSARLFLYVQYHAVLLRFATACLKAEEPAERVVNEVLNNVLLNKQGIADIKSLRLYLFTAVRNNCLAMLAKCPDNPVAGQDHQQTIKSVPDNLLPGCRTVYEMIVVNGLRNQEVAQRLNIPVGKVEVQFAIALKKLVQTVRVFKRF